LGSSGLDSNRLSLGKTNEKERQETTYNHPSRFMPEGVCKRFQKLNMICKNE